MGVPNRRAAHIRAALARVASDIWADTSGSAIGNTYIGHQHIEGTHMGLACVDAPLAS